MTKPIKIAVTGSAGSGKTFVCSRFRELGMNVISADTLARDAVAPESPAYERIVNFFGEAVLREDGTLNRQMLRRRMITDERARKTLEQIIHPEIQLRMQLKMSEAEQSGDPAVIVEVPLLFESGTADRFDAVITVAADRELQIKRLVDRDGISRDEAKALLMAQMSDDEKIKQSEFVIENNGTPDWLKRSVDAVYEKICRKYLKRIE
ncbi:MAG: dephospho-CoA kinase [Pseudomonadota bacterium]